MRIRISMRSSLRLENGVIWRGKNRCFGRIKRISPIQFHERTDPFRVSAFVPDSGVFVASIMTVSKLSIICYAVRTLLANNLIPDNTSAVLSKISYFLFIPCTLFIGVGSILAKQGSLLIATSIFLISLFQISIGLMIGALLSRLVPEKSVTSPKSVTSTESVTSPKSVTSTESVTLSKSVRSERSGLRSLVTVCCGFGNPWTLATLFLTNLYPEQTESVQGMIALFLLAWNPLFWGVGSWILSKTPNPESKPKTLISGLGFLIQPPTLGLISAVLVCLWPMGRRLISHCPIGDVAGSGILTIGLVVGLRLIIEVMRSLSTATLPIQATILGAALASSISSTYPLKQDDEFEGAMSAEILAFLLIALGRFVIVPALNLMLLEALNRVGALPEDKISRVMLFTMSVMPPAQNLVLALNLKETTRHLVPLAARFLLGLYILSIFPITLWVTSYASL